ncbi:hypothetical protein [Fluviicola taffensis]|uniref:Outer membrane protein beta-barrel domain-containing protein n=1 Tax=Fluviicola taffensis (strain DSM 16823 / NCIMB 13979 / RW262) TaxID=755732 RepID=F2IIE1_FLUTR|nr:hypothetical protein [Fluviicola taffensis]AEA44867.1 hypothetical protein Fluta_2888 [Fluviicola taffensis DSM 16823]
MYKLTIHLLWIILVSSSYSFSQTNNEVGRPKKNKQAIGFYGNRFFIQLGGGIHHNSILKIISRNERHYRQYYYQYLGGSKNADQFNYSVYGNLGVQLNPNIALTVDFNYYFGNMFIDNYGYREVYNENTSSMEITLGRTARINYRTIRIMPKIELGLHGSNSPIGLVNVIGLGVELSTGVSKNYDAFINDEYNYLEQTTTGTYAPNTPFSFSRKPGINITALYGLEYRYPLTKSIALNFGGYLTLNIPVQAWLTDADIFGKIDMKTDSWKFSRQLSIYRFQNLASFRVGVMFML